MNSSCKILGISASLRNARRGLGNVKLVDDLKAIPNEESLFQYLHQEAAQHLENFVQAGRKNQSPFDVLYKNLKKLKGDRGLSNSEVALAASLWAAHDLKAEIDHVSLSEYFSESATTGNLDELKDKLRTSDGFILSTPVYFGDRSSLAQSLIDLIRSDNSLRKDLHNKIYAGIAVGAKRNGGQETTLIYQMLDMVNCGLLGVGNDSETTSQYGGTGHAGDIGTMSKDQYGINTSMGAGRRIARVANMMSAAQQITLRGKPKVMFLLLQDKNDVAKNTIRRLISVRKNEIEPIIVEITKNNILRCLACDVCPTHVDLDEIYRCIIKSKNDDMSGLHDLFMDADAIIPTVYSPIDQSGLVSNYQKFMERTRYLRRGDYVLSDMISCPFVIEELGANENLAIRMLTSTLRHHTIIANPLTLFVQEGKDLNFTQVDEQFQNLTATIREVTKSRLIAYSTNVNHLKYKPVGYVLASSKDQEDEKLFRRQAMIEKRMSRAQDAVKNRLIGEEVLIEYYI